MAGFRTIVINKRCKLESQLGSLVIRSEIEERIHIAEIETLIIESTAVAFTSALIADLSEVGANIIVCDRKHLPTSVFLPVHAHFSTAKKIKEQIAWSEERKAECWKYIIIEKIRQQALYLSELGKTGAGDQLVNYQNLVDNGDTKNYEARAASVYFRALFGKSFSRNDACEENDMLNYGYTLLMATFAREIMACGYLTELGIEPSIIIPETHFFTLSIENKVLLLTILSELRSQSEDGKEGAFNLLLGEKALNIERSVSFITDFTDINFNSKPITNLLIRKFADFLGLGEQALPLTQLECIVLNLVEDFRLKSGLNVEYNTSMNGNNIAKVCSLKIADDGGSLLERLCEYVNLLCDLKPMKLFVLAFAYAFLKLNKKRIPQSKVRVYLPVTQDVENANHRLQTLYKHIPNFKPYAMPEQNPSQGITPTKAQKEFARYVFSQAYRTTPFNQWKY